MDKQTQRARALAARRAMTEAARTEASAQICRRLMRMKEVQNARTVFSYLAVPEEADLSALHQWLTERGCRVAFPVTRPDGIMHAFAPAPPWRFERGLLGIRSPVPEYALQICPEEIDLVLAPCVAFDENCRRLGHGGGYYDRFLFRERENAVCLCFRKMLCRDIPEGEFDVRIRHILTEDPEKSVRLT